MTYGEPQIRKCVPLALGLISSSKPQLPIIDALSKYSHDQDLDVALNAIFAMGLVGAGTNNARLAQMLRMLAVYYATEPDCLFVIRIAQVCACFFWSSDYFLLQSRSALHRLWAVAEFAGFDRPLHTLFF
jgi:hypothetical protein